MGTRIDVQTLGDRNADSQAWIANRKGMDTCRPITLDLALFAAAHHADGFIPSGTLLGKVTTAVNGVNLYGPYDPAAGDGRDVNAGHLFDSVQMEAGDTHHAAAALFWEGIVRTAKLPAFAGTVAGELDANGRTDVAAHIRYEDN